MKKLAVGMTPDRQAHNRRVTQRAMKRFGMVPGNDSRTVFGTLLGPLLCCSAFAEEAAASDRSRANRPERRHAEGLQMAAKFE
ncbi:MAG: hypothetical protein WAN05_05025 [Roseiarcus sp.]